MHLLEEGVDAEQILTVAFEDDYLFDLSSWIVATVAATGARVERLERLLVQDREDPMEFYHHAEKAVQRLLKETAKEWRKTHAAQAKRVEARLGRPLGGMRR